jgi:hypothetical protein
MFTSLAYRGNDRAATERRAAPVLWRRPGDSLEIVLVQPADNPSVIMILWRDAPTITTPARYNEVASTAMRLLPDASTTLARIRASKHLWRTRRLAQRSAPGVTSTHPSLGGVCDGSRSQATASSAETMAPKLRESWRRSAAISDCAGAARRAHDAKAEKYGVNRSIDPGAGPFGGF